MTGDTGIHEQMIGDDSGQGTVSALAIVSAELMETIRNAHLALEDCVDGRGGTAALVRAGELLHQARGALRITETYGAALLVEEMELCCKFLSNLRSGKGREDGLDALTRSMVQLPIYIERLLGGGRDIALVLLPMLNDLRAARGEPLLSEGTLLLLNLSPTRSKDKRSKRKGKERALTGGMGFRNAFQAATQASSNSGWSQALSHEGQISGAASISCSYPHSHITRQDFSCSIMRTLHINKTPGA